MFRKTVAGALLALLLVSMLALAFEIQPVKASEPICIREDGSVYPPTAPIQRNGNYYILTGNIYSGIEVRKSNVIVDGNGYALLGDGSGKGFSVPGFIGVKNVTIQNTNIKNFSYGIYLGWSSCNTVSGNMLNSNRYSFGIWGSDLSNFMHRIDVSNLIDGKPAYYLVNQTDLVINPTTYPKVGYLALTNCDNVTVEGLTLTNSIEGILLAYTNNSRVTNCAVSKNVDGIYLYHSSGNRISGNIITSNAQFPDEWGYGIALEKSHSNLVENNTVMNNCYGIRLMESTENCLSSNNMTNNTFNFGVYIWTKFLGGFIQSIDTSNIVNGKPIYYMINQHNITIDPTTFPNIGYLGMVNSTSIVVKNLNTTNVGEGVLFAWTNNSTIENVQTSNNHYGLAIVYSNSNVVSENTIESIYHTGIKIFSSNNNIIISNTISESGSGFGAVALNSSIISRNIISNSEDGVLLQNSFNNEVEGNSVKNSSRRGMILSESSYNQIFHNNFINNTEQVQRYNSANAWDDGYPSGGNFWSDYSGEDLYLGPYQNETGSDGIGDSAYIIDENNVDHYPLMNLWSPPDGAIVNVTTSKTIVGQGYALNVTLTLSNQGNKIEELHTNIYANSTLLNSQSFLVRSGNSLIYAFEWNTSGFAIGTYAIRAYVEPILGETDVVDNRFVDGIVRIFLIEGPYYTWYGAEYWIVEIGKHPIRLVSNY